VKYNANLLRIGIQTTIVKPVLMALNPKDNENPIGHY
jgi:hypothetical protein